MEKYRLLELRHTIKELFLAIRIVLKSKLWNRPGTEQSLYVAMVDGEGYHGGMCDRFKGIISLYAYCKYHSIPFRIRYTYPFRLEDYLSPSVYDWTLKAHEYTDNPMYCRVLYMKGEHLARRLLELRTKRQVHFYTNRDLLEHVNTAYAHGEPLNWGKLFRELFKPGAILQERIKAIQMKLNLGHDDGYVGAVFRFQNLLGDFKEYHYKSISDEAEKEQLIEKCIVALRELRNKQVTKAVLVTSDSNSFLQRAAKLDNVHTIPGTLVHIDGNKDAPSSNAFEIYLKSFLDFYLLSEAKKIYRIGTERMYPSEFPVYAAKVHGIPFESIVI